MKKKLTTSDIKFIADKFQWSAKDARSAIKEFLENLHSPIVTRY
jgi:nucleoid DNA-binding protein